MKTMKRKMHIASSIAIAASLMIAAEGVAQNENTAGTDAAAAPVDAAVALTPEQIALNVVAAKAAAKAATDLLKAEAKSKADAVKAETKAKTDAAKADAKAAKELATAKAKADKEAAAKTAAEAKAAAAVTAAATAAEAKPAKIAQVSQNGVTRPRPDGACGQVWALADKLSQLLGQPVPIAHLIKETQSHGLNDATTRTQYARWKTFNSVFGPVAKIAEVVAPVAPAVIEVATPAGEPAPVGYVEPVEGAAPFPTSVPAEEATL